MLSTVESVDGAVAYCKSKGIDAQLGMYPETYIKLMQDHIARMRIKIWKDKKKTLSQ